MPPCRMAACLAAEQHVKAGRQQAARLSMAACGTSDTSSLAPRRPGNARSFLSAFPGICYCLPLPTRLTQTHYFWPIDSVCTRRLTLDVVLAQVQYCQSGQVAPVHRQDVAEASVTHVQDLRLRLRVGSIDRWSGSADVRALCLGRAGLAPTAAPPDTPTPVHVGPCWPNELQRHHVPYATNRHTLH